MQTCITNHAPYRYSAYMAIWKGTEDIVSAGQRLVTHLGISEGPDVKDNSQIMCPFGSTCQQRLQDAGHAQAMTLHGRC